MYSLLERTALIGFGEAAMAFAEEWGAAVRAVRVFDIKTLDLVTAPAKLEDYRRAGVKGTARAAIAVRGSDLLLSMVTADQAIEAARSVADALEPGALYFDFNSVAPQTKREAAGIVEAAGGRYVDVAVMAPVEPKRLRVPLLVSGPHAVKAIVALAGLGFAARIVEGPVGRASAIKMLRSIIVKGIEALTAECFLAADAEGVAAEVARSLDESDVKRSWSDRAAYNLERMRTHGLRRAAEMDEAARTVEAIGGDSTMARATAAVQRRIAEPAPSDKQPGTTGKARSKAA